MKSVLRRLLQMVAVVFTVSHSTQRLLFPSVLPLLPIVLAKETHPNLDNYLQIKEGFCSAVLWLCGVTLLPFMISVISQCS